MTAARKPRETFTLSERFTDEVKLFGRIGELIHARSQFAVTPRRRCLGTVLPRYHGDATVTATLFPEDSAERKTYPIYSGLLQYFPSALAAVANHSFNGNEKHNPGEPLHHDRAKSGDEPDAMLRHLMEGDYVGMAWRALAMLQKHLEAAGAPVAPGARNAPQPKDHRRVATPAEINAYKSAQHIDHRGWPLLVGDLVRVLEPFPDGAYVDYAKVAGKDAVGNWVCLQIGTDTRWARGDQLEVIPA